MTYDCYDLKECFWCGCEAKLKFLSGIDHKICDHCAVAELARRKSNSDSMLKLSESYKSYIYNINNRGFK